MGGEADGLAASERVVASAPTATVPATTARREGRDFKRLPFVRLDILARRRDVS
jgi:hypothetical protein